MIDDKKDVLEDLLSLAGHLTDILIDQIQDKKSKLALAAQTPPTLFEWIRKQVEYHLGCWLRWDVQILL